jgi:hypothetical protein
LAGATIEVEWDDDDPGEASARQVVEFACDGLMNELLGSGLEGDPSVSLTFLTREGEVEG